MPVDSHQHFWRIERGDYAWLTPELGPLHRDFLPGELQPQLSQQGISQTVLVQAAASEAETHYMLELADQHAFIGGVVGWIDMLSSDAPERVEKLARHPRFRGLRPMLQDLPDPGWILKQELRPALEALIRGQLSFDALVRPTHLPHLLTLLDRHPELRVVVDHAAKPTIAGETEASFRAWANAMGDVAAHPRVHCKLSGLLTEAEQGAGVQELRPYVELLLERFGAARVMWGSDWPVLELRTDYANWYAIAQELLSAASPEERTRVFGGTAAAFYRLDPVSE